MNPEVLAQSWGSIVLGLVEGQNIMVEEACVMEEYAHQVADETERVSKNENQSGGGLAFCDNSLLPSPL